MLEVLVLNCNKNLISHFFGLLENIVEKTFCSRRIRQIPNKKCNFFQNKNIRNLVIISDLES